jgi:threonylcarbamoyladenosine tRNA methylthiotransferase CDKAL1
LLRKLCKTAAGKETSVRFAAAEEIPVADGCRGRCTFCITRLARGRLRSRPVEEVVARVKKVVSRGCVEVRLAAQDIGLYGNDLGTGLPRLLERVCAVDGNFRVRVGMMNPESLLPGMDRLMRSYANPKMFKFLHVPVQRDGAILPRLFKRPRNGTGKRSLRACSRRTSSSVSRAKAMRSSTKRRSSWDAQGRTSSTSRAFSPRPGTPAFYMKDRPGRAVVQKRIDRLQRLRRKISLENNRRLVGTIEEVLVTEKARLGGVMARTSNYHPVLLEEDLPPGSIHRARIAGARTGFLVGEINLTVENQLDIIQ